MPKAVPRVPFGVPAVPFRVPFVPFVPLFPPKKREIAGAAGNLLLRIPAKPVHSSRQ